MKTMVAFSDRRFICVLTTVIVVGDIIACLTVTILWSRNTGERRGHVQKGLSVDCRTFEHVPGILTKGSRCMAEDSTTNVAVLAKLSENKESRTENEKSDATEPIGDPSLSRPHAFLKGVDMKAGNYPDTILEQTIETWTQERPDLRNGMRLRNGRLVVPRSGIYHIFSHIDFGNESSLSFDTKISHKIYRFNILNENRGEENVLSTVLSPCLTNRKSDYLRERGSYVSAMVSLQAGDYVSVRVTHMSFLRNRPNAHYFGMHLLGS